MSVNFYTAKNTSLKIYDKIAVNIRRTNKISENTG